MTSALPKDKDRTAEATFTLMVAHEIKGIIDE